MRVVALPQMTGGVPGVGGAQAAAVCRALFSAGRKQPLGGSGASPAMAAVPGAVSAADVAEFARGYARPGGWRGAAGIYRSILSEGEELRALAARTKIRVPVFAVGGSGGSFTAATLGNVAHSEVTSVLLNGVGHHVALEAPAELADALLGFLRGVDG